LDQGWIPGWLEVPLACSRLPHKPANVSQNALKADTGIGFQRFKPAAFSKTATSDLFDPALSPAMRAELEYTLRKVRKIFRNAFYCQTRGRDENAWCYDVVRPMVRLALRLYAKDKLYIQSVYFYPTRCI
jgi:hypothetical protein